MRIFRNCFIRGAAVYSAITAFCLIFAFIYHSKSYGVTSGYMSACFAFPLAAAFTYAVLAFVKNPGRFILPSVRMLFAFGTATLTVWCIMTGVLEIAGAYSHFMFVYVIAGVCLIAGSVITAVYRFINNKRD